jgi:DNA-binding IclR family transcriptional regulator
MPDPATVRAYATRNTLRALEELAAGPCSAPELAERLAIGERSARKLLQRCAVEGWATQGDWHHRRYSPTLRVVTLARQALDESALLHFAAPQLQDLAARGGRTSSLWIGDLDRDRALQIMRCSPGGGWPPEITLGPPIPLHRCAPGRLLSGSTTTETPGAAPIHDEHGTLIAAIAISPATSTDTRAVADAGRIITSLIRDGVL